MKGYRIFLRSFHSKNRTQFTQASPVTDSSPNYPSYSYANAIPLKSIPGPLGVPFFGTLFDFKKVPFTNLPLWKPEHYHVSLIDRYKEYGDIWKEKLNGTTVVHLCNPEYYRTVFQNEGKIPYVHPLLETTQMYRKIRNLSPGLGNINGEEWYRLRSAVQQMMMRPKEVVHYLPLIEPIAQEFIDRVKRLRSADGSVPNLHNEVAKWQLEC